MNVKQILGRSRMKNMHKKRRYVTLVEMMIVMFLIAMITGVIAYNYTGGLEEGKAFKTKTGMDKIHTILDLHLVAHQEDRNSLSHQWENVVRQSQLVKNPEELMKDGWGNKYEVSFGENDEITIKSKRYDDYQAKSAKSGLFVEKK